MADGETERSYAPVSNPLFQDIHGSIANILGGIGSTSKSDITDKLTREIDGDDLLECRDFVFKVAVGMYDEQMEAIGLTSVRARLELKQRRGDAANEKCASDIVDMALYVCGLTKYFPRDVLSSRSTYVDLDTNTNNTAKRVTDDNAIASIITRCDEYDHKFKNMWEYVLNVEKVLNDEITDLKRKLSLCSCTHKELNGTGTNQRQGSLVTGRQVSHTSNGTAANPNRVDPRPTQDNRDQLSGHDLSRPAEPPARQEGARQKDTLQSGRSQEHPVQLDDDDDDEKILCAQRTQQHRTVATDTDDGTARPSTTLATSTQTSPLTAPALHSTPQPTAQGNTQTNNEPVTSDAVPTFSEVAAVPGDWNLVPPTRRRRRGQQRQQGEGRQTQTQTQTQQTSAAQDNALQQPALNTSLTGLRSEDAVDINVENIEAEPARREGWT